MRDTIERDITAGLASMRDTMGIPQPDNVIEFPRPCAKIIPAQQTIYGRMADALIAIERVADYMGVLAKEIERRNLERQKIIDLLRQGESSARSAVERLEG
jgi:hypothetical protein